MTAIELPDFAFVLLFGDGAAIAALGLSPTAMAPADAVLVEARLEARRLTAVDATGLSKDHLQRLSCVATDTYARVYGIAADYDAGLMQRRLGTVKVEAFFDVGRLSPDSVSFVPVATDRRGEGCPFDIIGDVHGCADELCELLGKLGYRVTLTGQGDARTAKVTAPIGRRAFFVGDLVDRGPNSPDVVRIVMAMVDGGQALCVAGNHDVTFLRWHDGRHTKLSHGLDKTAEQFARESHDFKDRVARFLSGLKGHLWVDEGRLAVAHAGVRENMIGGRAAGCARSHCTAIATQSSPPTACQRVIIGRSIIKVGRRWSTVIRRLPTSAG